MSDHPELETLANDRDLEQAIIAAHMLGATEQLDDTVPPGSWSIGACTCCSDGVTVRMREHRGRSGRSTVRKVCKVCDWPDGTTIDDLKGGDDDE